MVEFISLSKKTQMAKLVCLRPGLANDDDDDDSGDDGDDDDDDGDDDGSGDAPSSYHIYGSRGPYGDRAEVPGFTSPA